MNIGLALQLPTCSYLELHPKHTGYHIWPVIGGLPRQLSSDLHPIGVACHGDEESGLAVLSHQSHRVLVALCHVPCPAHKTGWQDNQTAGNISTITSMYAICQSLVHLSSKCCLVRPQIQHTQLLGFAVLVHHPLLIEPTTTMDYTICVVAVMHEVMSIHGGSKVLAVSLRLKTNRVGIMLQLQ
jgi:hypothetical protein